VILFIHIAKEPFMNKCSCCGSNNNIRELDFDEGKSTFFVILCEDCWNELKTILNSKENT
jgi:hypothetical protein